MVGTFAKDDYNGSMESITNKAAVTAEFYEEYARANDLDSMQLCLLDLLYQGQGGPMTWIALQKALGCPRSHLITTVQELMEQDLVDCTLDLVWMTLSAPFMVEEVLEDLHNKFDQYASRTKDDMEAKLLA